MDVKNNAATPEPAPQASNFPHVTDLVVKDLAGDPYSEAITRDLLARKEFGMKKYGTALQPFNGRDVMNDLYQEILDGLNYARQALFEYEMARGDEDWDLDRQAALINIYHSLINAAQEICFLRGEQP